MAANEVPVRSWSERLLVRRICASDRDACVQLVKAHHGPVYRLLFHLCRDAHLAEDLTQETFAAAWQGSGSFKGSSSLATWLHRIAYRKFVDACRRGRHRVLGEPLDQVSDQVCSNAPGQLESVLADERCRNLYQGLARLEQAECDVLVLHYLQGLSFRQMAEVLAEPAGTVKWRTSQALARLKILLDGRLENGNWQDTGWNDSKPRIDREPPPPIARAEGA